jgi:hypothetical protein
LEVRILGLNPHGRIVRDHHVDFVVERRSLGTLFARFFHHLDGDGPHDRLARSSSASEVAANNLMRAAG